MFSPMFVLHQVGSFDFWWWMTTNLIILITICFITDRGYINFLREDFSENILKKTGKTHISELIYELQERGML